MSAPVVIAMHAHDNVAIVGNEGGLAAGTEIAGGPTLREKVPQAHKVALVDLPAGAAVIRYGVTIGRAVRDIAAGSWIHERLLQMPSARSLEGLPCASVKPAPQPPLAGYTFEGYRNADGSVGTRNLLAITTTVQCVAGVLDVAVDRIRKELLPRYPHVDGVVGLEHTYGCGVAIDAPGAEIPIRTLRNISQNPNFGGEVMLLSLGCEKLQPERLLPPGSIPIGGAVRLQDEQHVGFESMVDDILRTAERHLQRLNACSAAAATRFPASPPTRRWASAPTCWCAPAPV
jgi:galactarate dehydratase